MARPLSRAPAAGHPGQVRFAAEAAGLGLFVYAVAIPLHEGMHYLVLRALGGDGVLLARPWHSALTGLTYYGLHLQPLTPLAPGAQALLNLLGPLLAAVPLAVLLRLVRDPRARAALLANLVTLLFYAGLETLYVGLESGLGLEGDLLTLPELNFGVPLLLLGLAIAREARAARSRS